MVSASADKPDTFFWIQPDFVGPIFDFNRVGLALRIPKRVQLGRVELKKGSNSGSRFNPISLYFCPLPISLFDVNTINNSFIFPKRIIGDVYIH